MFAYITSEGTAMGETAICGACKQTARIVDPWAGDWNGGLIEDCTGNEALICQWCGVSG
jgi:hypothetical protein